MHTWLIVLLGTVLLLGGCSAKLQTAKTTATVPLPGGRDLQYESGKDQQGIDAAYETTIDPATGKVIKRKLHLKVDKSGTPEAAYAAMVEQQKALTEQQKAVTDLIKNVLERMIGAAPSPAP